MLLNLKAILDKKYLTIEEFKYICETYTLLDLTLLGEDKCHGLIYNLVFYNGEGKDDIIAEVNVYDTDFSKNIYVSLDSGDIDKILKGEKYISSVIGNDLILNHMKSTYEGITGHSPEGLVLCYAPPANVNVRNLRGHIKQLFKTSLKSFSKHKKVLVELELEEDIYKLPIDIKRYACLFNIAESTTANIDCLLKYLYCVPSVDPTGNRLPLTAVAIPYITKDMIVSTKPLGAFSKTYTFINKLRLNKAKAIFSKL